jgi:Purple acid Phosphatase, N-terminal domain
MRSLIRTSALVAVAVICFGGVAGTALAVLPCGIVSGLAVNGFEVSQGGTINVNSVPAGATFSLRGAARYSETTPWSTSAARTGRYTISWGNMAGYTKPSGETKTLTDGGNITFTGNYIQQGGTINVNSVPAGATFSLSGAARYNGTAPWSTSAAPKGSYTISWGDLDGYTKPPGETKTLTDGSGITFTGNYVQQVAAINVSSVPAGATFSLSGAASYSGTAPWSTSTAPKGSYTISWGDLDGYTKPSGETKTLTDGGGITFTGNYVDAAAPVFYSVIATDLTGTSATIIWTTSEDATSLVEYGLTTGYGSTTTLALALVQSHRVALIGLSPKTIYHYRVKSTDASGNLSQSADHAFTTADIDAPMISNVTASNITGIDATITWITDDPAESAVEYGTSAVYGSTTTLDTNRVTEHSVNLAGLSVQTTYHYKVKSRDASGLWAESADFMFTTGSDPGATPLVISNVIANDISGTKATIIWTTDRQTTGQVEYGLTTDYGKTTNLDGSLQIDHSVDLKSLKANRTYHYRVTSRDALGNQAQSEDRTFDTTVGNAPSLNLPTWAWAVIGVAVALVVGIAIIREV